jgi:hypothetical protein
MQIPSLCGRISRRIMFTGYLYLARKHYPLRLGYMVDTAARHTAIISLNNKYELEKSFISPDGRCIMTEVIQTSTLTPICKLVNIYAPANRQHRPLFYHRLLQLLTNTSINKEDMIIMGDFNLHVYDSHLPAEYLPFLRWLQTHFIDGLLQQSAVRIPTFTRGESRTIIDYMFIHNNVQRRLQKTGN